jgi:hypothetical protein
MRGRELELKLDLPPSPIRPSGTASILLSPLGDNLSIPGVPPIGPDSVTVTITILGRTKAPKSLRQDVLSRSRGSSYDNVSLIWTYRERSRCSSHRADLLRQQGPGRERPPQPWLLRRGLGKADLKKEEERRPISTRYCIK